MKGRFFEGFLDMFVEYILWRRLDDQKGTLLVGGHVFFYNVRLYFQATVMPLKLVLTYI